jgi:hypothetical protein
VGSLRVADRRTLEAWDGRSSSGCTTRATAFVVAMQTAGANALRSVALSGGGSLAASSAFITRAEGRQRGSGRAPLMVSASDCLRVAVA